MEYQSTRSNITANSLDAVLQGPASDGGLFIDPKMDKSSFPWQELMKLNTIDIAKTILTKLLPDFPNMESLVEKAYKNKFETDNLTPLVEVGDCHILELFRGPTSAFKDVALSILPYLMQEALKRKNSDKNILILTATSGDTGKAALEGFHDIEKIKIIVFYPQDGVSPIQKMQMVTQKGKNVLVCAVNGNFDDCQGGVKKAFLHLTEFAKKNNFILSSANSINIGRLAPQTVYYFSAYRDLLNSGKIKMGQKIDFCVPTGNFGDIFAGFWAKQMGLPIGKLICASNTNRILTDFFSTGIYDTRRKFYKTTSPSMDILISSNLERLLFWAFDKDTEQVKNCMQQLASNGFYKISGKISEKINESFSASFCSQENSNKTIKEVWEKHGYLMDPHTSVAWFCAHNCFHENPLIVLSTASPYKFVHSVLNALEIKECGDEFKLMQLLNSITKVPIPHNLAKLQELSTCFTDSINTDKISDYVKEKLAKP